MPKFIEDSKGYVPAKLDFRTSTSIWLLDDLDPSRHTRDWKKRTKEDGIQGSRAGSFRQEETVYSGTYSIFSVRLAEYILLRYAPPKSRVLDAFAGGPPRGLATVLMGHEYYGVDIRQEAIDEDLDVVRSNVSEKLFKRAHYILDDATELKNVTGPFDFAFTCPPYYDLEKYSEAPNDLSNLGSYSTFNKAMRKVASHHYRLLKANAFVCLVVGNFRNPKTHELIDFRGDTVRNFKKAGFLFWQDVALAKAPGSAAVRAARTWQGKKLVPRHEYLVIFRKPEK